MIYKHFTMEYSMVNVGCSIYIYCKHNKIFKHYATMLLRKPFMAMHIIIAVMWLLPVPIMLLYLWQQCSEKSTSCLVATTHMINFPQFHPFRHVVAQVWEGNEHYCAIAITRLHTTPLQHMAGCYIVTQCRLSFAF